jgi:hypothetical protein
MSKKINHAFLFTALIVLFNFSCTGRVPQGGFNPSVPPTTKPTPEPTAVPTPPPVGSDVDISFLQTFNPAFAAGMKYTDIITVSPANKPEEVSIEITAVAEDSLKVKIKTAQGTTDKTYTTADFTNPTLEPSTKVKFKYAGKEDIKVPAGDFKGATKITLTTANGTFTGWLATGIGTVKKIFIDTKKITTTTQLKEFK